MTEGAHESEALGQELDYWGRVSDPNQAALTGSHQKASGYAGGYLLYKGQCERRYP